MTTPSSPVVGQTKGYKSTEFWVVTALTVLSFLTGLGVINFHEAAWDDMVVYLVNGIAASAYAQGRANIKTALVNLSAKHAEIQAKQAAAAQPENPAETHG